MAKNYYIGYDNLLKVSFFLPQWQKTHGDKTCTFPAFITNLSDNFTSNWSVKTAYGFQDQVGIFTGTNRSIALGLRIAAADPEAAREYQQRLNMIAASLYPQYDSDGIPSSSPIIGLKIENLVHDNGFHLFGWLNGLSLTPNVTEGGFYNVGSGYPMIPTLWDMSFEFNVLHNNRPGFSKGRQPGGGDERFPVQLAAISAYKTPPRPTPPPAGQPKSVGTTGKKTT